MWTLVIYDIRDAKRLNKIAKIMEGYGKRIQKSVFGCSLKSVDFLRMQREIEAIIKEDLDSVKYFPLCLRCQDKGILMGKGKNKTLFSEVKII